MRKNIMMIRFVASVLIAAFSLFAFAGCDFAEGEELSTRKNYKNSSSPVSKPSQNQNGNANGGANSNNNGKKRVALTFDDGPHNVRTKAIVDELSKYGYEATFFVVGNRVDGKAYNGAEALKQISDLVVPSVGEEGLYKGFLQLGLI